MLLHTIRAFEKAYVIQSLKDFGFTKFKVIVVSHFFCYDSKQSFIFPLKKCIRAPGPVLCKILIKVIKIQQLRFQFYLRSDV